MHYNTMPRLRVAPLIPVGLRLRWLRRSRAGAHEFGIRSCCSPEYVVLVVGCYPGALYWSARAASKQRRGDDEKNGTHDVLLRSVLGPEPGFVLPSSMPASAEGARTAMRQINDCECTLPTLQSCNAAVIKQLPWMSPVMDLPPGSAASVVSVPAVASVHDPREQVDIAMCARAQTPVLPQRRFN